MTPGSAAVPAALLATAADITTIGPQTIDAHELPLAAIGDRLIVSDSPQQIGAQGNRHMPAGHPRSSEIVHLGEVLTHPQAAGSRHTLYLSAGLAGTEVALLAALLVYRNKPR